MLDVETSGGSRFSGLGWFLVAAAASVAGSGFGRLAGPYSPEPGSTFFVLMASALTALVLAGLATWRIVRCRADSWLLPLAALNLVLLEPGRAGNAATWRTEWGVFGIAWTVAAVFLFARLLARTDELQRRIHLEGAAVGLALAVPLAMAYALLEPSLPPLRAQGVTIALLLLWWGGWSATAWRYR